MRWLFSTRTFDSFLSLLWRLWFVKRLSFVCVWGGTLCCFLAGGSYALLLKTFRRQRWQRETLDCSLFNLAALSVCKDYQQTEPGHKVQREIKAQMEKETQGFGKLYKCADQKALLYLYTQVSPKVNCSVKPWTRTHVFASLSLHISSVRGLYHIPTSLGCIAVKSFLRLRAKKIPLPYWYRFTNVVFSR